MKPVQFELTEEQSVLISAHLDEAEMAWRTGAKGGVFFQVFKPLWDGNMMASGSFVPNEYAVRIKAILQEMVDKKEAKCGSVAD